MKKKSLTENLQFVLALLTLFLIFFCIYKVVSKDYEKKNNSIKTELIAEANDYVNQNKKSIFGAKSKFLILGDPASEYDNEYSYYDIDGSIKKSEFEKFDLNKLTYDKEVNKTMVKAWSDLQKDTIEKTMSELDKKRDEEKENLLSTYRKSSAEDKVGMAQHNKSFQFNLLKNNYPSDTTQWATLPTNKVGIYYNKNSKNDIDLVVKIIDTLLEKVGNNKLYDIISLVNIQTANQFDLEDVQYSGEVKLVLIDNKLEWRKLLDIKDEKRFIDALEFYSNDLNKINDKK